MLLIEPKWHRFGLFFSFIINFGIKKKKNWGKEAHENLVSANGSKEELVKLWVFTSILLFLIFENISINFDKNLEKKKKKEKKEEPSINGMI